MFPCQLDDHLELRVIPDEDVETLFALIDGNREHLDTWMLWSSLIRSVDDARTAARGWADKYAAGNGFHVGIYVDGQLAGGMACRYIDHVNHKSEIGYWLVPEQVGKGIVVRACKAVIDHLFAVEKIHRIEIQAVTANTKSRAVAERLGFTLEGILRESGYFVGKFHDHALYSLLENEWAARQF